jgi:ABC-type transporter Mla maintaining outer membrane lipid asymmetry ATPase subunit MlaF
MLYEGRIIVYGTPEHVQSNSNPFLTQFLRGTIDGPIQVR